MSVALNGTVAERLREAIGYMHKQRKRVVDISRRVTRRESPQIIKRFRGIEMRDPTAAELEILIDRVISENPDFKAAIANEQWGYRLTSAYALVRAAEQNDEIISLLRDVRSELQRLGREDRDENG